jgi:hypothetical protein
MTPEPVYFTELDVYPREMLAERWVSGPFPPSWERLEIDYSNHNVRPLVAWVAKNIPGRFGIIQLSRKAVVYFEDVADLMLFRMLDGEIQWKDNLSF